MKQRLLIFVGTLFFLAGCGATGTDASTDTSSVPETQIVTQSASATDAQARNGVDDLDSLSLDDDNMTWIDIMVVAQEGNDTNPDFVDAKIDHFIAVSNHVFEQSGLDARLRIVERTIRPLEGETALDKLMQNAHDTSIENERNLSRADIVIGYAPYANDGRCGIAFVNNTLESKSAYAQVALDCPATTTAHEIGHTMGLVHDPKHHREKGIAPYAKGYGVDGEFVTVMAYASLYHTSTILQRYSSPEADCMGYECGDASEDDAGADAVRALRSSIVKVSQFR